MAGGEADGRLDGEAAGGGVDAGPGLGDVGVGGALGGDEGRLGAGGEVAEEAAVDAADEHGADQGVAGGQGEGELHGLGDRRAQVVAVLVEALLDAEHAPLHLALEQGLAHGVLAAEFVVDGLPADTHGDGELGHPQPLEPLLGDQFVRGVQQPLAQQGPHRLPKPHHQPILRLLPTGGGFPELPGVRRPFPIKARTAAAGTIPCSGIDTY
ncbi:hypothetical protein SF12_12955 [Streptomyces sp. MBRL 601]|nr:hypothetical protein SF12_12955 [Streptomyces sp. MBRL 601]